MGGLFFSLFQMRKLGLREGHTARQGLTGLKPRALIILVTMTKDWAVPQVIACSDPVPGEKAKAQDRRPKQLGGYGEACESGDMVWGEGQAPQLRFWEQVSLEGLYVGAQVDSCFLMPPPSLHPAAHAR